MRPSDPPDEKLLELMSEISEEEFCAGWLDGLEFDLWAAVHDRDHADAPVLPSADVAMLRGLSDECGGWWVHVSTVGREWSAGTVPGRVFLPIDAWRELYAARRPT